MFNKRLALTPGEPAGIGPDLVVQLAQQGLPNEIVIIADPEVLKARAQQLQLPLEIIFYDPQKSQADKNSKNQTGQITILPITVAEPVIAGQLDVRNAQYVMNTLHRAIDGCLQGEFAGLVTGPVHKGIINQAGITFSGHTELLAELTNTPHVVMLLATGSLRVALATTHLPLHKVPAAITTESLTQTLTILHSGLQKQFAIKHPKILVCGLNPHAGENGYLGTEEIDVIIPVLEKLRNEGLNLIGPAPADTAFIPKNLAGIDAVLAMYHDQGLPVLKNRGFDQAINITLGLPFLRTSVDHGTALELAGTGLANASSLHIALGSFNSSKI